MGQVIEPLNGGLVTSRDPSLLQEGELQQAEDVVYVPNNVGLHKAPGRTKFNPDPVGQIIGLRYCSFDDPDSDLLVVHTKGVPDGAYHRADAQGAGSFIEIEEIENGETFDSVHYNNRHYLLNGRENRVLLKDGTTRQHGMAPVTDSPGVESVTSGGVWPLGEDGVALWYEYWTTEVYKSFDENGNLVEEIESTFQGKPTTVFVAEIDDYNIISRPSTIKNLGFATHWRIYRSVGKATLTGQMFPSGFRIGEKPLDEANTTFFDGKTDTPGAQSATTVSFGTAQLETVVRGGRGPGALSVTGWNDPNNVLVSDNARASCGVTFDSPTASFKLMMLQGFNFGSLGSPIAGIQVFIEGFGYNSITFDVYLSGDAGITWTNSKSTKMTSGSVTDGGLTTPLGGENDTWGKVWSASEMDAATFRVGVLAWTATPSPQLTEIDHIAVQVWHSGTTAIQAIPFDQVAITTGPVIAPVGRHGLPPVAFTGDIFEDSLVTNDVENPAVLNYSTQENPDSYPPVYVLSFQTKDKDRIRCIRTLGNVLIVGLYSKLFRINYLPRELDAEFDRGRAIDVVSLDHGIVSPRGACVFQMDGQPLALAYVSRYGIHLTDGYRTTTLTDDLDWADEMDVERLDNCELVNDPSKYQLVLFYEAEEGSRKKMHFYYHPSHLKGQKMKVTGPINYSASCAANATLDSGALGFYTGNEDGHVYVENTGVVDESGGEINPLVTTREIYAEGQGNELQLRKVLLHQESDEPGTVRITPELAKTNGVNRLGASRTATTTERGLIRFPMNEMGEAVALRMGGEGGGEVKWNYLVLEGDSFGTEDSLK